PGGERPRHRRGAADLTRAVLSPLAHSWIARVGGNSPVSGSNWPTGITAAAGTRLTADVEYRASSRARNHRRPSPSALQNLGHIWDMPRFAISSSLAPDPGQL